MDNQKQVYNAFYKSQDRFLEKECQCGFEPDIISEYLYWGMIIASRYEQGSKHENPLMCEMFLRQIYFHLLEAIRDPNRNHVFRQICLDSIHTPLLSLKRYYSHWENGDLNFLKLQQLLQRLQTPLDE